MTLNALHGIAIISHDQSGDYNKGISDRIPVHPTIPFHNTATGGWVHNMNGDARA